MDKKEYRVFLIKSSEVLAEKLGHLCGTCSSIDRPEKIGGRCCVGCAGNKGYLPKEEFEEAKDKYNFDAHMYDPNNKWDPSRRGVGFLTPTGCALPREIRSETCLRYTCWDWKQAADKDPVIKEQFTKFYNAPYQGEKCQ